LLLIGLVGAPNKGKSTLFSAMTAIDVQIADYAFTTIKPNLGVAYATAQCVDGELKVKCTPRNSMCINGTRRIPINVIDVAGLVPGAHLGKGMGNQFLGDLMSADAIIQVVDLSGKTDMGGAKVDGSDPSIEVEMVQSELAEWLSDIILKHMPQLGRRSDGEAAFFELLSGFRVTLDQIQKASSRSFLSLSSINWDHKTAKRFSTALLAENKPFVVAANKADQADEKALGNLKSRLPGIEVIACSAAIELALAKASNKGLIEYFPGATDFKMLKELPQEQKSALEYMHRYTSGHNGTGVQELLNHAVFRILKNIVVYPVEDETHYSDHSGNILPDAILMRQGSTAYNLAEKIHTDIAKGMKYALDARSKMRLQKEYVLRDRDVIKIVSTSR